MTPLPYLYGILAVSRIVMQVGTAAIDRARKPTAAKYPPATLVVATLVGMSLLRVVEPLIRTRRPVFLLFVCYAFIYFAIMLPSKFWALATLNDGKWGTR